MGLFDIFKKKRPNINKQENKNASTSIIYRMRTPDGNIREFKSLEQKRYKTFRSDYGWYTDFYVLCREKESYYLLEFSHDTTPTCVELVDGDYEKLVQEDEDFWYSIIYYAGRKKIPLLQIAGQAAIKG